MKDNSKAMPKVAMGMQREHSLFYVFFLCLLYVFCPNLIGILFLEVLVILAVFPVASPSESFCLEEAVAEVALS